MAKQSLTIQDWENTWENNTIPWHLDHVNTYVHVCFHARVESADHIIL